MPWNWQLDDWPDLRYDAERLAERERTFLRQGGELVGAFRHLRPAEADELAAEAATSEAMTTSAIEGEILDRQSVRSSILRHLGIAGDLRRAGPREDGAARLMADLLQGPSSLTPERLFGWHRMLMQGRPDISALGAYRTQAEPMRIISGAAGYERVHFEAPPSDRVPVEMERFLAWFGATKDVLPPLARAGIAHLRFESIHPFEDGNGRIGRAIAEVALAQALERPSLAMLSTELEARRSEYYAELEHASRGNEATPWVEWFADAVLAAQRRAQDWVNFLIAKTRLLDRVLGSLNPRQEQALLRMLAEGPSGFVGGLSSGNYQRITGASPATAGRDLAGLVESGALRRTGSGKGARYWIEFGTASKARREGITRSGELGKDELFDLE